jgi:hypothetical protein
MLAGLPTALLPMVEDPISDTIGLSFTFSTAGAGGVIALTAGGVFGVF